MLHLPISPCPACSLQTFQSSFSSTFLLSLVGKRSRKNSCLRLKVSLCCVTITFSSSVCFPSARPWFHMDSDVVFLGAILLREYVARHSVKPLSYVHRVRPSTARSTAPMRQFDAEKDGGIPHFCLCLLGKGRHDGTRSGVRCYVPFQYLLLAFCVSAETSSVCAKCFVLDLYDNVELASCSKSRNSNLRVCLGNQLNSQKFYVTDEQSYSVLV